MVGEELGKIDGSCYVTIRLTFLIYLSRDVSAIPIYCFHAKHHIIRLNDKLAVGRI